MRGWGRGCRPEMRCGRCEKKRWGQEAPRAKWAPRAPLGTALKSPALFEEPTHFLLWGAKLRHLPFL